VIVFIKKGLNHVMHSWKTAQKKNGLLKCRFLYSPKVNMKPILN